MDSDTTNDLFINGVAFERYRLLSFISSGARGAVYKVEDTLLQKVVALKVLNPQAQRRVDMVRFQSEARILSKLKHPNIAQIFDFGVSGERTYLTIEFLDGESLEELLKREKTIDRTTFIEIFIQLSKALIHAHEQGVIHRDIKPSNIVVTQTDAVLRAVLVDFGIATAQDSTGPGALTEAGAIIGSPLCMSPEQCLSQPVSNASDAYSLGCVMWQCVSGKMPFDGESAMEIIWHHATTMPPPLRPLVNKEFTNDLIEAIEKLLAKDPKDRPGLADSILPLLERLEDAPDENSEVPVTTNQPGKSAFSPWILVLLGLVITGTVVVCFAINQKPQAHSKIETGEFSADTVSNFASAFATHQSNQNTSTNIEIDDNTLEKLISERLASTDPPDLLDLTRSKVTDKCFEKLARLKLRSLNLHATDVSSLSNLSKLKTIKELILANTRISDSAAREIAALPNLNALFLRSTNISDPFIDQIHSMKSLTLLDLSETKVTDGFTQDIIDSHLTHLLLDETAISAKALEEILTKHPLQEISIKECFYLDDNAQKRLAKKFPAVRFLPEKPLTEDFITRAQNAEIKRDYASALANIQACLSLVEQANGPDSPYLIPLLQKCSYYASANKNDKLAVRNLKKASALIDKYPNAQEKVRVLDELASCYLRLGNLDEAVKCLTEAQEIARKNNPDLKPTFDRFIRISQVYRDKHDWKKCHDYIRMAMNFTKRETSPQSAELFHQGYIHMAEALRYEGKFDESILYSDKFLNSLNPKHKTLEEQIYEIASYSSKGQIAVWQDKTEQALALNSTGLKLVARHPKQFMYLYVLNEQRASMLEKLGTASQAEIAKHRKLAAQYKRLMAGANP